MRPKTILLFVVLFLAALCDPAEPRPAPLPNPPTSPSPPNPSPTNSAFTFADFKQKYSKHYSSVAEENYRRLIFEKNMRKLNAHNSNATRKYSMKPNAFMDVSKDEFRSVYGTARRSDGHSKNVSDVLTHHKNCKEPKHTKRNNDTAPSDTNDTENNDTDNANPQTTEDNSTKNDSLNNFQSNNNSRLLQYDPNDPLTPSPTPKISTSNHTSLNKLALLAEVLPPSTSTSTPNPNKTSLNNSSNTTVALDWSLFAGPVRFQGYCGACYAFSTVDTVSAHYNIYHFDFFIPLSVQQVIDCTDNGLTYGCNGGYLEGSLTQIQMHGIVSQDTYPFTSGSSGFAGSCQLTGGSFKVVSFQPLAVGLCSSVVKELERGPVSAGISGYNLRFYDSGVFDDCSNNDSLDHAIMIVGYKSGTGWRIKNSWGVDWGDNGFGWVAEGNTCGICNMTVAIVL